VTDNFVWVRESLAGCVTQVAVVLPGLSCPDVLQHCSYNDWPQHLGKAYMSETDFHRPAPITVTA
jgi:hypothetical protein